MNWLLFHHFDGYGEIFDVSLAAAAFVVALVLWRRA